MSPHAVLTANAALLDVADGLAAEFADVATGSVLRCFSRAVAVARHSGTPVDSLPTVAEDLARRMLAGRVAGPIPADV